MKKVLNLSMFIAIAAICFSCSNDDNEEKLKVSLMNPTINVGQTTTIKLNQDSKGSTFVSENENIASVNSSGIVTGERVGTTSIKVKNKNGLGSAKINVLPNRKELPEPFLNFGASRDEFERYFKSLPFKFEYIGERGEQVLYKLLSPISDNLIVTFSFKNNKYESAAILGPYTSTKIINLFGEFCRERYVYLGEADDVIVMESIDKKATITISTLSTGYVAILFMRHK